MAVKADPSDGFLTGAQVGRLIGVSRQRVHQLADRPGFPKPAASLPGKRLWLAADIREWIAQRTTV